MSISVRVFGVVQSPAGQTSFVQPKGLCSFINIPGPFSEAVRDRSAILRSSVNYFGGPHTRPIRKRLLKPKTLSASKVLLLCLAQTRVVSKHLLDLLNGNMHRTTLWTNLFKASLNPVQPKDRYHRSLRFHSKNRVP